MKALNSRLIFNSVSAAIEFKGIVQMFKLSAHLSVLMIKCPNPYVVTLISAGQTLQSDVRGMNIAGPKAGLAEIPVSFRHPIFLLCLAQKQNLSGFLLVGVEFGCCFFLIPHIYPYLPSLLWGNTPLVPWQGEHSFKLILQEHDQVTVSKQTSKSCSSSLLCLILKEG